MWFDSHCHLYDIESDDPAEVVARADRAGVTGMLVVGVDAASSERALALTELPGVWAGAACHPTEAKGWTDAWAAPIDALLVDPRVVAVGESGIDLHWDTSFFDDQRAAFVAHIGLAKKHDKALVIHTRDSLDETFAILEAVGPPSRLVFHCWSGDRRQVEAALEMGAYVSFAGNVSFKSADDLRGAVPVVPLDRILVETDAPYLTPVPHRGKRNEPAYVVHVGAAVAAARAVSIEEVAVATSANARQLFGLDA